MARTKKEPKIEVLEEKPRLASSRKSTRNYFSIINVLLLVVAAYFLGVQTTKIQYLENGVPKILKQYVNPSQQQVPPEQPKPVTVDLNTIKGLFKKNLMKFGDGNKKLLFVEFADPSCPYCHIAAGKNPELNAQAGDRFKLVSDGGTYVSPVEEMRKLVDTGKASFIYIYQNGHGNGELSTKALYCAYDQQKFWEAHDKLMTNEGYELINNEVKNDKSQIGRLTDYLSDITDSGKLKSCLESGKYDNRLSSEMQLAQQLGVRGTPGFFVNTTNFAGAYNWTEMKSAVDTALK